MVGLLEIKRLFSRIFIFNWPRKLVAFLAAIVVWFLVNESITATKNFPEVLIKVIDLPKDTTIIGLMPNGYLKRPVSLTLTGSKQVLDDLTSQDITIVINAAGKTKNWVFTVDKQSLQFSKCNQDYKKKITDVFANDIFLRVADLVTDEVIVTVTQPLGDAPEGYLFLDVVPKYLRQKIRGPKEEIEAIKKRGIDITFNLDRITQAELDQISRMHTNGQKDEIDFYVPKTWKEVKIGGRYETIEPLNDPAANFLKLVFIKQKLLSFDHPLPLSLFFPSSHEEQLNPETISLQQNELITKKNGLYFLELPLFVKGASPLFLEIVKDQLLLSITVTPKSVQLFLDWTLLFINQKKLEDQFVEESMQKFHKSFDKQLVTPNQDYLKNRFQQFMTSFRLYLNEEKPLKLKARLEKNQVIVQLDT